MSRRLAWWGLGMLLIYTSNVWAAYAFTILHAQTKRADNVYRLSANMKLSFSEQVVEALQNGVPITLTLDMKVYRELSWWWDDEIAMLRQSHQIRYQVLTKQYMVKNLNTGLVDNFATLQGAYDKLGVVDGFPLIDSELLDPSRRNYTLLRIHLDVDSLPVPLRLRAYFSSAWSLRSEWMTCEM